MGVNSYAEIFTTLIGWQMYNVIWDVLMKTGILILPFLVAVVENWRLAFIEGDEAATGSGIRAIEMEIYLGIFVVMIAGMPTDLAGLNRSEVFYAPPVTTATPSPIVATGDAPDSTFGDAFGSTPAAVKVPVWWAATMALSSGVTSAIISGAGFKLDDLRKVTDAAKRASIDNPQVRFEAQRFFNECYIPARTKFLGEPASPAAKAAMTTYGVDDPEWMGSHAFRDDPNLYQGMYAAHEVPGWPVDPVRDRDRIGAPVPPEWGRPTCSEWWEGRGTTEGVRDKIINEVRATSKLSSLVTTFGKSLTYERRQDIIAQTALDKTRLQVMPDPYVPATSNFAKDTFSSTTVMIAGFMTTFFTWLATAVLKPSLPFVQALLLMGVYAMLPFVLVFSRYSLSVLMTGALAIFTIKMWSVLWFLTDFLDDRLVRAVYPDADSALSALSSFFQIGDPTKAMLLNLVVMSMYLALPALWSGLMGMVGLQVGKALSSPFIYSMDPARVGGKNAGTVAQRVGSAAAGAMQRGAGALRSRLGSDKESR